MAQSLVAKGLNFGRSPVSNMRRKKISQETRAEIIRLHESGMSVSEISNAIGRSTTTVFNAIPVLDQDTIWSQAAEIRKQRSLGPEEHYRRECEKEIAVRSKVLSPLRLQSIQDDFCDCIAVTSCLTTTSKRLLADKKGKLMSWNQKENDKGVTWERPLERTPLKVKF